MAKKKAKMPAHDRAALRRSISDQVTAMIARCEHLRDEGRTEAARRMLVRIEALTAELKSLEG